MAQHITQSKAYRNLTLHDIHALDEHKSWELFVRHRWGSFEKVSCPSCSCVGKHYFVRTRRQWRCKYCSRVFSVTSDMPFSGRRIPFKKLVLLIYISASRPKGVAANQVCAELGVTFRTAFQNLGKLREMLFETQDRTPLAGIVQIDGGHFCGKPRRPRKKSKISSVAVNNHLKNRKASIDPTLRRSSIEPWNAEKLKNRRIVLTLRQLFTNSSQRGAERTITVVLKAETTENVVPVIKKYVAKGACIQTDDGHAYSSLAAWYNHQKVRHSVEYSTELGINNNQAESYIGRVRRAEYGTYHGMRPQYLAFYAAEFAWREDVRRMSLREKFDDLMRRLFRCDISRAFRGYCQGHHLKNEYLG